MKLRYKSAKSLYIIKAETIKKILASNTKSFIKIQKSKFFIKEVQILNKIFYFIFNFTI
jgi:hypothetical protein